MNERTLLFLHDPVRRQLLLALKKRGFGAGKWNGVGGKIDEGETVEAAAVREAYEEIGVVVDPHDLISRSTLRFSFEEDAEEPILVHVFFCTRWEGEPTESEEMRPSWYSVDALPFDDMWVDDRHWLPKALHGAVVDGRFHLSSDGSEIVRKSVKEVE